MLSRILEQKQDYKAALEYRKQYENLKDSIHNEENDAKIAELEARYQDQIKKKEITSLQTENRLKALEIKKKSNQNYLLTGFILLITILALLVLNQYRIKQKNNSLLKQKNKIIEKALEEKEVLLREIHHRVKNNLQFIWSLFNLQARHVKDAETLKTLIEAKNRIKTMALIHQKLYMGENLTGIDMVQYIPGLTANIFESFQDKSKNVKVEYQLDTIVLDIDTAIPLALIMNEIITNAIKYAFEEGKEAKLIVALREQNGLLTLRITDNGGGFADIASDEKGAPKSFGLKLVQILAKQVKGEIAINTIDGVDFSLTVSEWKGVNA